MTLTDTLCPREGVIGSVVGEGEGCEGQALINAQRTILEEGPGLRPAA